MKNEFTLAFNEVLEEKGLPRDVVLDALQAALASAYRRHVNASNAQHVDAKIDAETGKVTVFAEKEVVDQVEDVRTEVSLEDAQAVEPEAEIGSMVVVETTPNNFGRVAAQTARQVIQQRIREAERNAQFEHYSQQMGEIVNGVVQAVNSQAVTLGLEMKAEGLMPRSHQVPGERFRVHDRVRALLLEVKSTPRGPQIILSRAHRNFLRRLLENEVPEIYHGMVEIRSIAREPGQRSKVAVAALQPGVDPVGACVGIRGVRIQAIVRELNDEKIDVIEWNTDSTVYIAKALSPARVSGVYLNEMENGTKTAMVVVPEDQLSLAIGRDGQNARLAAKLTSWRIDIKSLPEAAADALHKLQTDPEFADIAEAETETVPKVEAILAKKAEGRPVTPEEYHLITQFVDHIERGLISKREAERKQEEERQKIARANIPQGAFEIPLSKFEISDRLYAVISELEIDTVGDVMLALEMDPDSIWRLNGMGPKAMAELEETVEKLKTELRAEEEALKVKEAEAAAEATAEAEAAQEDEEAVAEVETAEAEAAEAQAELEEAVEPEQAEEPLEEAVTSEQEEQPEAVAETEAVAKVADAEGKEAPQEAVEPEPEAVEDYGDDDKPSLEELFTLIPEEINFEESDSDEEDEIEDGTGKKKKKKKRKKYVEIEYDPDADMILTRKKRKRGDSDWEEEW
jgi:N utilization substance protein A